MSKKTQRAKPPGAPEKGAADELYFESVVANRRGVSRERVRELRVAHLREGEDWVMQGTAVVLSAQGLARMQDLLRVAASHALVESEPAVATDGALAATGPEVIGVVAEAMAFSDRGHLLVAADRCRVRVSELARNEKVVMAVRVEGEAAPGEPARLLVRVRSNEFFMPGMEMEVVPVDGRGCFQYLGRLPRRKGVW